MRNALRAACCRFLQGKPADLAASDPSPALPQVFAPLARLLGLYSIKEELEELSFK